MQRSGHPRLQLVNSRLRTRKILSILTLSPGYVVLLQATSVKSVTPNPSVKVVTTVNFISVKHSLT